MAHASGVGRLMQVRGAAAHDTEWDVALVSGFRGLMVGNTVALMFLAPDIHLPAMLNPC